MATINKVLEKLPKTILQEYCQKKKLPFPKYITFQIGKIHPPIWASTVELYNKDNTPYQKFPGEPNVAKIKAEHSAAEKALSFLDSIIPQRSIAKPDTVLIVDVENMPTFINTVLESIEGLDIYAFVNRHHPLIKKEYPPCVNKMICPTSMKDGTDTYIQVYMGYLLSQKKYKHYCIVTRDHFGLCLVEIVKNNPWESASANITTQIDHIPII